MIGNLIGCAGEYDFESCKTWEYIMYPKIHFVSLPVSQISPFFRVLLKGAFRKLVSLCPITMILPFRDLDT